MFIGEEGIPKDIVKKLERLKPWSHYFKFDENTFTGFYPKLYEKYNATFCSEKDTLKKISDFRETYNNEVLGNNRLFMPMDFIKTILGQEFYRSSLLDIGCNDGMKTLYFKKLGVLKAKGVEIRKDCIERAKFVRSISGLKVDFEHIPVSADSSDFCSAVEPADIVASLGILYHLVDHKAHIENLRKLTKRVLVFFSSYQIEAGGLTVEDKKHPYKSYTGHCKMPSRDEIFSLFHNAGFEKIVELKYHPSMGSSEFMKSCIYLMAFV